MTPPPADTGEAEAARESAGSITATSIEVSRHILSRILSNLASPKVSLYFESTTLSLSRSSFLSSFHIRVMPQIPTYQEVGERVSNESVPLQRTVEERKAELARYKKEKSRTYAQHQTAIRSFPMRLAGWRGS